MGKVIRWGSVAWVIATLVLSTGPLAWAKHGEGPKDTPRGWHEGKKTGWHGADRPPGLEKKEEEKEKKHHKKHKKRGKEEEKKEGRHHKKHKKGEKGEEKKERAEQGQNS